jgi:hypothetical protein
MYSELTTPNTGSIPYQTILIFLQRYKNSFLNCAIIFICLIVNININKSSSKLKYIHLWETRLPHNKNYQNNFILYIICFLLLYCISHLEMQQFITIFMNINTSSLKFLMYEIVKNLIPIFEKDINAAGLDNFIKDVINNIIKTICEQIGFDKSNIAANIDENIDKNILDMKKKNY